MKPFASIKMRAILAGVLLICVGATLGFAQPQAEKKTDADSAQSPVAVATPGVLVAQVQAGSPAEKAGISRGDIILEVQGTVVNTLTDLERVLQGHKAGDALSVKLKHGDAEKTVSLTLGTLQGRPWAGIMPAMTGPMVGGVMRGMSGGTGTPFAMGMNMTAAEVTSVVSGSPADKAGIVQGDVILSLDGTRMGPRNTLSDMVGTRKTGDTVTLSVQSTGQDAPRDVKVTLGKNPDKDGAWLGIGYTWARQGRMPGIAGGTMMAGVLVAEVADNGPAAAAGIKARDIITGVEGISVASPQTVVDVIAKHKTGDALVFTVYRMADDKETEVTVTLGQSPTDPAKAYVGISMSNFVGFEGMPYRGSGALPRGGNGKSGGRHLSDDGQKFPTI
jgi:S1-C subfamily serine protease